MFGFIKNLSFALKIKKAIGAVNTIRENNSDLVEKVMENVNKIKEGALGLANLVPEFKEVYLAFVEIVTNLKDKKEK